MKNWTKRTKRVTFQCCHDTEPGYRTQKQALEFIKNQEEPEKWRICTMRDVKRPKPHLKSHELNSQKIYARSE